MTRIGRSGPASSSARRRAACGSGTVSTRSKWRGGELGELGGGERAVVRALGCDERRAGAREPLEDPGCVLVAEDRGDDDVAAGLREPLEQPVDGLGRVRAVPDLAAARSKRPGRLASASSTSRPRNAAAASRAPPSAHVVLRDEMRELLVREDDDGARPGDRELLARDRLARVAEHLRVLERRRS